MIMHRRDGTPQWVALDARTGSIGLVRADLSGKSGEPYSEAWLQDLLHHHPSLFPVEQIEPGFGDLIPLCKEMAVPLGAGRVGLIDNLFVTAEGGLVLIEAKLWRNPEARRTAVAQAMEYAGALFRLDYGRIETAVLKARGPDEPHAVSLFDIVAMSGADADEAEFHDALTRNLRRGRAIIALVGDGIREDIAPLAEMLQSHAGARFTFALVELAIYETPGAVARLVVPSVLAQTQLIERGVIRIDGPGGMAVSVDEPVATTIPIASGPTAAVTPRAMSISEDEFFEVLTQKLPEASALLRAFLSQAESLGVYPDFQRSLNLKHPSADRNPLNLASIYKEGFVETGPSSWFGREVAADTYNQSLATAIEGRVVQTGDGSFKVKRADGRTPRITELLPDHQQTWLAAMAEYIKACSPPSEIEG